MERLHLTRENRIKHAHQINNWEFQKIVFDTLMYSILQSLLIIYSLEEEEEEEEEEDVMMMKGLPYFVILIIVR